MSNREWWKEQWLDLINSYHFKKRLERGWKYAREGNVLSIEFEGQKVIAKVKGTESEPYQISLWLDIFSDEDWNYIIEEMSKKVIFSAKLLAGEMPHNIEEVFAIAGKRLFPFSLSDVRAHCSCPDQANPCKHISAVYYLLGDRFGEDPFVLFQLRGRTKKEILTKLRQLRGKIDEEAATVNLTETYTFANYPIPKIQQFWNYDEQLESSLVVIIPPPSSATVLDILGSINITNNGEKTHKSSVAMEAAMEYLRKVYQEVSQQAVTEALNND
ncbi:hypothetical protein BCD67_22945 [Oscillatoriales cyanobacterium USR001]|nr:hypothetical protein BCD67_22945 [Oscillatoriales cyanobacterium USR001]